MNREHIAPPSQREYQVTHREIGQRVWRLAETESTNALALTLAHDPRAHGLAIWADAQTAGRGRLGRSWFSEPGAGVLLSVLVFPPTSVQRPVCLTAWAAVAVCETIYQTTGRQPRIKWPNDVLLGGKKVCGILVEQRLGTVVGIGLNVNTSEAFFAAHGLRQAASLSQFTQRSLDVEQVGELLLDRLDAGYAALLRGQGEEIESAWRWYSGLWGRDVLVQLCNGETYRGRLLEMGFEGLILQTPCEPCLFLPEEIAEIYQCDEPNEASAS
ncbi:MAG: biotin--[acetyl-CoA-carboxylase] ligase [Gemmatales bacterium]|nr:biotin--[acetyl-CoA-carboxylase] ligase [Gemmatales bacterium]MDW7993439.1 biotin--[acetyl-CoA-carboxylase] ligase [Gemmatales bacterium]